METSKQVTNFFDAITSKDPNLIEAEALLRTDPTIIHATMPDGDTAFFAAVMRDSLPGVRFLLEHGADVNARDALGDTALLFGVKIEIMRVLLEHGADVNAKDNDGNTALHFYVEVNALKEVELLLEHGADVNAKNNDGDTASMLTTENSSIEMINLLKKHELAAAPVTDNAAHPANQVGSHQKARDAEIAQKAARNRDKKELKNRAHHGPHDRDAPPSFLRNRNNGGNVRG